MGHLREVSKSVSLDDVAEVATTGFRSMGTQREDSLVFVLGLLNLGTVLCYAIYAQLVKPIRRGLIPMDDTFVFKKIQTILDELVLHVHTTTYYSSSLEKSQELNKGDSIFQGRSSEGGIPSLQGVFSFFDLPEPAVYGEKPPPLPLTSTRRSAEDYQDYLQEEAKKMVHEWLSFLVQSTPIPKTGRLTKRHTRMPFPNAYRRYNATIRHTSSAPQIKKTVSSSSIAAPVKSANRAEPQQPQKWNRNRTSQRRPQIKRPVAAATGAEADGRVLASVHAVEPDVSYPTHQQEPVPVLPVHTLFPHETVREASSSATISRTGGKSKSGRSSSRSGLRSQNGPAERTEPNEMKNVAHEPRHIPSEFHQQLYRHPSMPSESPSYDMDESTSASVTHVVEEDGLIVRLMHLIQQTTPLAMDVLGVYKSKNDGQHHSSTEPKCLERLLCQLNQDWKNRGSVPAAMAPFLR